MAMVKYISAFIIRALVNKAKQPQSRCSLDCLAVARFVRGFATVAQNNQQQVSRCLRRYTFLDNGVLK